MEKTLSEKPEYEIWFFDESRFGTRSRIGHGWFEKGKRIVVKMKLGFKNFYTYTAVSPKTGENFSFIMPYVNTQCMNSFLKEMSKWLKKRKVMLVMDGAGWHKSKELKIPRDIEVVHLPAYSPELNPVERLWQYLKENVLKNKLYDSLMDLERAVCDFIKRITSEIVCSICHINYIDLHA